MTETVMADIVRLADGIFDHPELCFHEYETSRRHCELLEKYGFAVERGVGGLETAYRAEYGHGHPVICLLAEMDALANMSQEADQLAYTPLPDQANGHGCGHHLLGAGALGGAICAKQFLEETGTEGTIVVMGCPAEENGSGKSVLVQQGLFKDVDTALSWHPSFFNVICSGTTQSYIQTKVNFLGTSSHAAVAPHLGRSALDALELMNEGIARLREHLTGKQKIHYAITDAGGFEPGVIQSQTEEIILLRAENPCQCRKLYGWLKDIIQGAALMTRTTFREQLTESADSLLPNTQLHALLDQVFQSEPGIGFTAAEKAYAQQYKDLASPEMLNAMIPPTVTDPDGLLDHISENPICDRYIASRYSEDCFDGSTDVGDVSQVCPVGVFNTACFSYGTSPHSWTMVAQGKSAAAHRGMTYGARIMAATAIRLFRSPDIVSDLWREWKKSKERVERTHG